MALEYCGGITLETAQLTEDNILELREDYIVVRMRANPEPDEMVRILCADCAPIIPNANRVDRTCWMDFLEVE